MAESRFLEALFVRMLRMRSASLKIIINFKSAVETFSIVFCSTRDTSPPDLCIMTLKMPDLVPKLFSKDRKSFFDFLIKTSYHLLFDTRARDLLFELIEQFLF